MIVTVHSNNLFILCFFPEMKLVVIIAIAVGGAVLLIIVVISVLWLRRRKRRKRHGSDRYKFHHFKFWLIGL